MSNKSNIILMLVFTLFLIISCSSKKSTNPAAQVPVLTTAAVSAITQTTAQCGGIITSDGGAAVFHRGVCWSTNPTPTYSDNKTYDSTGTGTFISSISGLTRLTQYYVRAYAMNDAGLGYGTVDSFTTSDSTGTVTDVDGNSYPTIKIGNQWWMAENLKVTHYRNGDAIPNVTDSAAWSNQGSGAFCIYNNDTIHVATYGRLYNWFAASDNRNIAPAGWHVPTDTEWKQLEIYLGMSQIQADSSGWRGTNEGGKMKETATTHWHNPNTGATNESGFSALPGGLRYYLGNYYGLSYYAIFWSCTSYDSTSSLYRYLSYDHSEIYRATHDLHCGFSVRCIKD